MTTLHPDFLRKPLAHRGLHDRDAGRPENSRAGCRAAIQAGYGIEIDLQLSADGKAMVFHDYDLTRLTGTRGALHGHDAKALAKIPLLGGDEGIPTLDEILDLVDGQVPLLIELKDQDGNMGPDVGSLEAATGAALQGYSGPVAVMSFNPHSVAAMADTAPTVPRGIVTSAYTAEDWPLLPKAARDRLAAIPDYDRTGACFVSHEVEDLGRPRLEELRRLGAAIFCWTVRSEAQEVEARRVADNITFEGYLAALQG